MADGVVRRIGAFIVAGVAAVVLAGAVLLKTGYMAAVQAKVFGGKSVPRRIEQYGRGARDRLSMAFVTAGVDYPPAKVVLVGLKQEKHLELWAADEGAALRLLRTYPVLAASGGAGPKLRRGDRQVPEGLYRIESLNPNSRFHLALRLNYPNDFDRRRGAEDNRPDLGSDIMIHGKAASVGCLAVGDEAAEELFVLAADARIENVRVILAPCDLRTTPAPADDGARPAWVGALYEDLAAELRALPPPTRAAPAPASPAPASRRAEGTGS